MTILVTGSTGVIGSRVVANLAAEDADVHAVARLPEKAKLPAGVLPVKADLMDIEATRKAIAQASTLFLLNAVTPDERQVRARAWYERSRRWRMRCRPVRRSRIARRAASSARPGGGPAARPAPP